MKLTENQKKTIISLTEKGLSLRQIALILGINYLSVHYLIKGLDIKRPPKYQDRKCVICGKPEGLIDDKYYSVCKGCAKILKKVR